MYTIVLMAALSSGQATGQYGTGCRGCVGCHGGYPGSGYNYMAASGYNCAFSTYAPVVGGPGGVFGCQGCYGCYGGWSCYGVPLANHGYWRETAPKTAPAGGKGQLEQTPMPKEQVPLPAQTKNIEQPTRARITLDVPTDAKVFLDGELLNLAAGKRTFQTPELVPGKTYYYDLRAEVIRDGRTVAEAQRIVLQPGQMVTASFPSLSREANVVSVSNRQD
jgi:uncharacterized protein (TIGR03000 family)